MKRFLILIFLGLVIFKSHATHSNSRKRYSSINTNFLYLSLSTGYSSNYGKEKDFLDVSTQNLADTSTYPNSTSISRSNAFQLEVGATLNSYFRGGIGLSFLPPTRISVVATSISDQVSRNEFLIGEISSHGVMGNIYWHPLKIQNSIRFSPYIMAGAGLYTNHLSDLKFIVITDVDPGVSSSLFNNSIHNFGWQLGTGAILRVSKTFGIDLSYKFLNRGKAHTKTSFIVDETILPSSGVLDPEARATFKRLYSHQIMIGAIIRF